MDRGAGGKHSRRAGGVLRSGGRHRVAAVTSSLSGEEVGGFASQVPAIGDFEFLQQQGNVKLDGAFGDLEARGDFLVGEALKDGAEDLFLTMTELNRRDDEAAILNDFSGARTEGFEEVFAGANGDDEVVGRLSAHEAMHGEHIDGALDGEAAVGSRFDFKTAHAGFFVDKKEDLRVNGEIFELARAVAWLLANSHGEFPFLAGGAKTRSGAAR